MKPKKYIDEQFIEAVKNNFSVRNVLKTLGLAPTGGSYKLFYDLHAKKTTTRVMVDELVT